MHDQIGFRFKCDVIILTKNNELLEHKSELVFDDAHQVQEEKN